MAKNRKNILQTGKTESPGQQGGKEWHCRSKGAVPEWKLKSL